MAISRQFLIFTFGVFLLYTGLNGVLVLASSINIEDGIGTTSLAVAYGSSILAAFVVPMLIERLGCRVVIALAELGYLLFVISNFYNSYNIVLGGFLYGIGEAGVWTAYPIVSSRFALLHSTSGSKSTEAYRNHYIGYLFTSVQTSVIFGSATGFIILFVDRSISQRWNNNETTVDYSICGANDCQDANLTMENLDQYTPAFTTTRYIVYAVFSLVILCAMALHFFFLPNDKPSVENNLEIHLHDESDEEISVTKDLETRLSPDSDNNSCALTDEDDKEVVKANGKIHGCLHLQTTIKASAKLFIEPKHLLIMLLPIYNGLVIGFVLSEVTRAFASCVLGLDKVGIGSLAFGTADALLSFVAGKFAGKYGRNIPYLVAFILDLVLYFFCLFWIITPDNVWMVYIIFFTFGVTDGIWQTLINVMYVEYFLQRSEIATNLWNVLVNVGTLTQFAISTTLCVYQKIYIQITVLCLAVCFYSISQYVYYHPRKLPASTNNPSKADDDQ